MDKQVTGTWRWSLPWSQDTIFNIVMTFGITYDYTLNLNINGTDTMHKESGTWLILSDTAAKQDTVWMNRMVCRQTNLATHTLDSIDCGIPTAGIKLNFNQVGWLIPLNDMVKYFPAGIIPPGLVLPPALFVKDTVPQTPVISAHKITTISRIKISIENSRISAQLPYLTFANESRVDLITISGKRIYSPSTSPINGNIAIRASAFPPGMYFLSITAGTKNLSSLPFVLMR